MSHLDFVYTILYLITQSYIQGLTRRVPIIVMMEFSNFAT